MPRAIWSGSISFGLVNVPVKLFSAVRQKEVRFHQLHDKDGARIQQKRVCSEDGKEVAYEHIVKGYEVSPGKYVLITPEELEKLDPEKSRTIDIEDFVSLDEIDPLYWEHSYHLAPDKGAEKAYSLLVHAMTESKKVAIARMVMRDKQYLCTLRPMDRGLVLSTMQYADELVPASDLDLPKRLPAPQPRELKMAEKLIDSLTSPFKPEKYEDDYREKVLDLIRRKEKGEEIVAPPSAKPRGKVVDLMEALQASLEKKPTERGERRHRPHAARSRRPPKRRSR